METVHQILRIALVASFSAPLACAPQEPVQAPPAAPSPPVVKPKQQELKKPAWTLPSGDLPPAVWPGTLEARVAACEQDADQQTLLLHIPLAQVRGPAAADLAFDDALVTLNPVSPLHSFTVPDHLLTPLERREEEEALRLAVWVRRPTPKQAEPSESLSLTLKTMAPIIDGEIKSGSLIRLKAKLSRPCPAGSQLFSDYLSSLGRVSVEDSPLTWLLRARDATNSPSSTSTPRDSPTQEWTRLMKLSSGYDSLEAALRLQDAVGPTLRKGTGTLEVDKIPPPALTPHPWKEMVARQSTLPHYQPTRTQPWAELVPADFYAVRAKNFDAFAQLIDLVDEIATPALHFFQPQRQRHNLSARYRLELGLPKSKLARLLGPHLVDEVVLIGSDPFLQKGSDLTLLLSTKHEKKLKAAIELRRKEIAASTQLHSTSLSAAGVEVQATVSDDQSVRQHLATVSLGQRRYVVVSNSAEAIRRVLATANGTHPALAAEADFSFMLARDAEREDEILAYAGDRFLMKAASPQSRLLEARRRVAQSELLGISYGTLLFRLIYGRPPRSETELLSAPWMKKRRLQHATSETISWTKTEGPRSVWGSPSRLTSLIDLPPLSRVSQEEADAYGSFRRSYEASWSQRFDPIALRADVEPDQVEVFIRVLPLVNSSQYSELQRLTAGGGTTQSASVHGFATHLAIGPDSPIRSLLKKQSRPLLGTEVNFDWLGESVEVGMMDDASFVEFAFDQADVPFPPGIKRTPPEGKSGFAEAMAALKQMPLYAAIDVSSPTAAALFLTGLKLVADSAAPDVLKWKTHSKVGKVSIVRVGDDDFYVYYALSDERLFISTRLSVMRALLQDGPPRPPLSPEAAHLAVDLLPRAESSALIAGLTWLKEFEAWNTDRTLSLADFLLRAAPETRGDAQAYQKVALNFLAGVPVTLDDRLYRWTSDGMFDPERGSYHHPHWPTLPVKNSPVDKLTSGLEHLRLELRIDAEPTVPDEQSLSARLLLQRHAP